MRSLIRVVLAVNIMFLLMLAFSYPFIEPGSGAYVVVMMALIPIGLSLVGSIVLIAKDWDPI